MPSITYEHRDDELAIGLDVKLRYKLARATGDSQAEIYDVEVVECNQVYAWSALREQWTLAEISMTDIECGSKWFAKALDNEWLQERVFAAISKELLEVHA